MAHFALFCPPVPGHLDPLLALGRALSSRGHRATVFHVADLESRVLGGGLPFVPLGADRLPAGSLVATVKRLAELRGLASLRFAVASAVQTATVILDDAPAALQAARVDAVIADQNEPAGATVAEHLGLPFVSVCTSLPLNREPDIPPPFAGWPYRPGLLGRVRNAAGTLVADRFIAPIQRTLNRRRAAWGLPRLRTPDDSFSTRLQLAQMPREFDFPRESLPAAFRYLGPWFDDRTSAGASFPFDQLGARPVVYGSLGTLQPHQSPYFRVMAEACADLDVQLVLSLGRTDAAGLGRLPGDPIVVGYVPQIPLLARASAVITHSGMNTTQQALYFGLPLVAIPLTHDQPAIAARTARTGAGLVVPPTRLTTAGLREAVRRILAADSPHLAAARRLSQASRAAGGVEKAAELIEAAVVGTSARGGD